MKNSNREIEILLDKMKLDNQSVSIVQLMEAMDGVNVFVPAVMPKNTSPEILCAMAAAPGKAKPIPQGANPQPCILENKDGSKLFPVFTNEEEIGKGENLPKFPMTINIPFKSCSEMAKNNPQISAIVINPFSHNAVLTINRNQQKQVKLTEPQLHALLRQQVESTILPKQLFQQEEDVIHQLMTREGEYLMDLYNKAYEQTKNCPYTPEAFEFMNLFVRDDLKLIRITMPEAKLYPGTCPSIFITWNPIEKMAGYYAIVKGNPDNPDQLIQVMPDGKKKNLGEAPGEGMELQSIIDLATK